MVSDLHALLSVIHIVMPRRARKILSLRLFENPSNGKQWDKSVTDLSLEVLCISQVRNWMWFFLVTIFARALVSYEGFHFTNKLSFLRSSSFLNPLPPHLSSHTHCSSHCAMFWKGTNPTSIMPWGPRPLNLCMMNSWRRWGRCTEWKQSKARDIVLAEVWYDVIPFRWRVWGIHAGTHPEWRPSHHSVRVSPAPSS